VDTESTNREEEQPRPTSQPLSYYLVIFSFLLIPIGATFCWCVLHTGVGKREERGDSDHFIKPLV
uniref:Uncharacterized protein n=1 Tax=Cynoglossus semilaevis TaxID=244447 RepID=A0A3P8WNY9_CYNSE